MCIYHDPGYVFMSRYVSKTISLVFLSFLGGGVFSLDDRLRGPNGGFV